MTPRQIEAIFKRQANALSLELAKAVRETAREGLAIARQDSSGRWNRKRRRKAGYSYSRRNPNPPPQPLGVINIETGVFLADWHVRPVRSEGAGDLAAYVVNNTEYAPHILTGGNHSLTRPIDRRVKARLMPIFQFNVERAIQKALRG